MHRRNPSRRSRSRRISSLRTPHPMVTVSKPQLISRRRPPAIRQCIKPEWMARDAPFDIDGVLGYCTELKASMLQRPIVRKSIVKIYMGRLPDGKKVIVKVTKVKGARFAPLEQETEYGYLMAEYGIGPKVYDSFFTRYRDQVRHCLVMEGFDDNCAELVFKVPPEVRTTIVQTMLSLIRRMMDCGMFCSDIKPDNFVGDVHPLEIRMIDFGGQFCRQEPPYDLDQFFVILLLQMFIIITEDVLDYAESKGLTAHPLQFSHFKQSFLSPFREYRDLILRYPIGPLYQVVMDDFIENGSYRRYELLHYAKPFAGERTMSIQGYITMMWEYLAKVVSHSE